MTQSPIARCASFNRETTLAGRSIVREVQRAVEAGYGVVLHHVGVERPDRAINRMARRVATGGHGIAPRGCIEALRSLAAEAASVLCTCVKISSISRRVYLIHVRLRESRTAGVVSMQQEPHTAYLGCADGYTSFSFGADAIRFRTPKRLQRYLSVRTWDDGYLVVDAECKGAKAPVEEYLDLTPILENPYLDPECFLEPIEEVRVA